MGKLIDKLLPSRKNRDGQGSGIKSFREQQAKEEAFAERDLGLGPVSLDQVVGSVGRYRDFDNRFRLRRALPPERLEKIKTMMLSGKHLPPVKLFRIKDEFYVLDGNHRVAAAKELGRDYIDAHIVEFLPSKNSLENLLYREKIEFQEKTGLKDSIHLTEIGQYAYLVKQIDEHRFFLGTSEGGKSVSFKEAALDWHETIYLPLTAIIEKNRLPGAFPKRTAADLYAYISFHQWEKGRTRRYGIGVDQLIPKNMEEFRAKTANMKDIELPEMHHWISAFILMTVKAGREMRVLDRLFEMAEVQEVHSVHGEFDLIAKISLKRDLLSSDAEMIGRVVYEKVRRIPDVISTQTLIPSTSRMKQP